MPHPPKPEARPDPPAMDDPEQYQRFLEAARELGVDETGEAFERALRVVLPPRKPGEPAPPSAERPAARGSRRKGKVPE